MIVQRAPRRLPAVHIGDRLEPACEGLPDFVHGETIADCGACQAKVLLYRKPRFFPYMFVCRLWMVPEVQRGVPGLKLDHILYDTMHLLELGVLAYLLSLALWSLVLAGFWGAWTEADPGPTEANIGRDLKQYYEFAGVQNSTRNDDRDQTCCCQRCVSTMF